jgi:hypothetical protein
VGMVHRRGGAWSLGAGGGRSPVRVTRGGEEEEVPAVAGPAGGR